jgi:hypothetical protein
MMLLWRFNLSIDPTIIGVWTAATGSVEFDGSGKYHILGSAPAVVAPNGQTLQYGASTYVRTSGMGQSVVGDWQLVVIEAADTWIEDLSFRRDGNYISAWTLNGAFDSVLFGSYVYGSGLMATREQRGIASTSPPDSIVIDVHFGLLQSGLYAVRSNGSLELTFDSQTTIYQPV